MDHDANVAPWLLLAEDHGLTVRWMDFDPETYEFADDASSQVLSEQTKLVAIGFASNCTGTINDVKRFAAQAQDGRRAASMSMPCSWRRIAASMSRHSAATSSYPRPTSGSARIRAYCGDAKTLLEETFGYKVRPAGETCRINSRPGRSAMKAWRVRSAPSSISRAMARTQRRRRSMNT